MDYSAAGALAVLTRQQGVFLWLPWRVFIPFIYSAIISSSASPVVPVQTFIWPWHGLWLAISQFMVAPDLDLAINLILAGCFMRLLVVHWREMRISYKIYTVSIIVISLSYYTNSVHPYMELPRHLLLAFLLFCGLGESVPRGMPEVAG
ncbi:MAG: hypothetical protein K8R89_00330 [Anaerolineae bacterium]|nr:hypothetical protein [Anaerolineae bacterium]